MKANHIPTTTRLKARINKLKQLQDNAWVKSPSKGNPYNCCKYCEIHTPQFYSSGPNGYRHFKNCPMQGIEKQIEHYTFLLKKAESK